MVRLHSAASCFFSHGFVVLKKEGLHFLIHRLHGLEVQTEDLRIQVSAVPARG